MPQFCPKCGTLQPDGPRCLNCGARFELPIETSQGGQVTKSQLRDYALTILAIVVIVMLFLGSITVACVLIALIPFSKILHFGGIFFTHQLIRKQ